MKDDEVDISAPLGAYTIVPTGSFPWALQCVIEGKGVRRVSWPDPSRYLWLVEGAPGSGPFIRQNTTDGALCEGWCPAQSEMLADDWEVC